MQVPGIKQRDEEWYKLRYSHLGSSEVGHIIEIYEANHQTRPPDKVFKDLNVLEQCIKQFKNRPSEPNFLCSWGIAQEPNALRTYLATKFTDDDFPKIETDSYYFYSWRDYNTPEENEVFCERLSASPDGIVLREPRCTSTLIEIKCPFGRVPQEGVVPKIYKNQLQYLMEILDLAKLHYVEYQPPMKRNDFKQFFAVTEVQRDRFWWYKVKPWLFAFCKAWNELDRIKQLDS